MTDVTTLLAGIRAQADKATPAPWKADTGVRGDCVVWGPNGRFLMNMQAEPHWREYPGETRMVSFDVDARDAAFIAAARTDVPRLIQALEAVEALHRPIEVFEYDDVNGVFKVDADGEQILMATYCRECTPDYAFELIGDCEYDPTDNHGEVSYPCPTITAITTALGGGE